MLCHYTQDYIQVQKYNSPLGEMQLASYDGHLCFCDWVDCKNLSRQMGRLEQAFGVRSIEVSSSILDETKRQLEAYFGGELKTFELPLYFLGTDFQIQIWQELCRIPYGKYISYAELAKLVGNPRAVRAVAQANAMNIMPIIVPCHRVLASAKLDMGGFSSGLNRKRYLLNLEQGLIMPSLPLD